MKEARVTIPVKYPDDVELSDVAHAINQMLDIGFADACETQGSELANEDSAVAASLDIGQPMAEAIS